MSQTLRFEPDIGLRSEPVSIAMFREQPLSEVHPLLELRDAVLHRLEILAQLGDLRALGVRLLHEAATVARASARDCASDLDGDENHCRAEGPAGNEKRHFLIPPRAVDSSDRHRRGEAGSLLSPRHPSASSPTSPMWNRSCRPTKTGPGRGLSAASSRSGPTPWWLPRNLPPATSRGGLPRSRN